MITRAKPSSQRHQTARELLALNVLALRREKGWSQEDLAFEASLHRTFIAHVERQARNISLDNIERIANAIAVPAYKLLVPPALQVVEALRPAQ